MLGLFPKRVYGQPISVGMRSGADRLRRMKSFLFTLLSVFFTFALQAEPPRIDGISFFKHSVGTWTGTGNSLVVANKSKLTVTDNWKGEFGMEGKAFVQTGTIKLSSDVSYDYRWVFQIEPKSGRVIALYSDSKDMKAVCLTSLAVDQEKFTITPIDTTGAPAKAGPYATLSLKDGRLSSETEVRDQDGKAVTQSSIVCVKQDGMAPTRDQ